MRLATYGLRVVAATWVISAALAAGIAAVGGGWYSLLGLLPGVFATYFFRDPKRAAPEGERLVLAPADGKVTAVERVENPEFVGEPAWRISIFLSIFDVHLNRAPLDARVEMCEYRQGKFLNALRERAAIENEKNLVGMASRTAGNLLVEQIAGVIARRIVCAVEPGAELDRGQRIGMIMFGSRTNLYLPCRTARITVKPGDKVKAGWSVVGEVI
jgi:phosphatidylserine decarboxylase